MSEIKDFIESELVCPYCNEELVRTHIQNEEGDWYMGWLCGCKSEMNEPEEKRSESIS